VDLAVHSIKDVPAVLPPGLEIGAIPRREDPRDVLITRSGEGLDALPFGARVGTSSLRRSAQLKSLRPDLDIQNLRGNLDTRLRKLHEGMYDAILLAAAGMHRMGWEDKISHYLDSNAFIPAIGQGAIGIEHRSVDVEVQQILVLVHDADTAVAVRAERSLLRELEGGCQVPIGGHAVVRGDDVTLTGLVASLDGRKVFRVTRSAGREDAEALGCEVARVLLDRGARQILAEIYTPNG
jgi:hydroxymethylbilane synthase